MAKGALIPVGSEPKRPTMPYFDHIVAGIGKSEAMESLVGKHVHWGVWDQPDQPDLSPQGVASAQAKLVDIILDEAKLSSGDRVADVGCGFGGAILQTLQRNPELSMVGLNIDRRQIDRARQLLSDQAPVGSDWDVVHGDACALPFEDSSFDHMLAIECIFHFPSRIRFFRHAARVLKPGGRLVLSDFVPDWRLLPHILWQFVPNALAVYKTYGYYGFPYDLVWYQWLGKIMGLPLVEYHDVTAKTVPTYDVLLSQKELFGKWPAYRKANTALRNMAKRGSMQYLILTFEKPTAANHR